MKCVVRQIFTEKKKEFDALYAFHGNNSIYGNLRWIETIDDIIHITVIDIDKVRFVDDRYLFI